MMSQTTFLMPSLLALYDTLNDDDDEIREAGADVVFHILGSRLAPLAASAKLLDWLYQKFGKTTAFPTATRQRITNGNGDNSGELQPAEQQLAAAMLDDDSLFVEEEQNLYIDEVREAIAWTSILATAEGPLWDKATTALSQWTVESLTALTRLAESEDGPFGWSSKPKVFAICMRVILTANALLARYNRQHGADNGLINRTRLQEEVMSELVNDAPRNGKRLRDAAHCLFETGRRNNLHPVLLEKLGKSDVWPA
jgi:hypothetical protein